MTDMQTLIDLRRRPKGATADSLARATSIAPSSVINAAGTTVITAFPGAISSVAILTVLAGAGAYTAFIDLSNISGTAEASELDLIVAMPASTNPTLTIRSGIAGAVLLTHQGTATATSVNMRFRYVGGAWVRAGANQQLLDHNRDLVLAHGALTPLRLNDLSQASWALGWVAGDWAATGAGSNNMIQGNVGITAQCSATANSSYNVRYTTGFPFDKFSGVNRVNWDLETWLSFTLAGAGSTSATGQWRLKFGHPSNSGTVGNLGRRGIQLRCTGNTTRQMFLGVHNGTTFVESSAFPLSNVTAAYGGNTWSELPCTIRLRAAAVDVWFGINAIRLQAAPHISFTSGGPTGTEALVASNPTIGIDCENGATATAHRIDFQYLRIIQAPA